ncbi:MAG: copper ion binding protein, partial [Roseovarius sp.]|uniref:heavy metal translocating P-type ATPase n=1 Tax=Roseovarius sp. TaxID=1486281 RepID=UPI0032EE238C
MPSPRELRFSVQNMSCASCVGRVERALSALPGVDEVNVNLAAEMAHARIDSDARIPEIVAALDNAGYPARTQTMRLNVTSMSCASCVGRVDKALAAVAGVSEVNVNLALETATVTYVEGATGPVELLKAAEAAGYPAELADDGIAEDRGARKEGEARALARRTAFAAALALPVFLLEMGAHLVPGMHEMIGRTIGHQASWMIQFVLTTIVLFWPGLQFYTKGFPALVKGAPD